MVAFTTEQFIFDTITQGAIFIVCIILYWKTRELFSLSLQKGVKYLNNSMMYYCISFGFRYITTFFDFFTDGIYGSFEVTIPGLIFVFLNMYGAALGGFYLGYSLVWRNFETDRIKRFHLNRVVILHTVITLIVLTDIFLMVMYKIGTPFLFFGTIFAFLIYAVTINCKQCKVLGRESHDLNPFISLVGLGLGVYIVILLQSLFESILFTVHYYTWGMALVFSLAFLYHVLRLTK